MIFGVFLLGSMNKYKWPCDHPRLNISVYLWFFRCDILIFIEVFLIIPCVKIAELWRNYKTKYWKRINKNSFWCLLFVCLLSRDFGHVNEILSKQKRLFVFDLKISLKADADFFPFFLSFLSVLVQLVETRARTLHEW